MLSDHNGIKPKTNNISENPRNITKTKKLQTSISHEHRCKNPQQIFSLSNPTIYKKKTTNKWGLSHIYKHI